MQDSFYNVLKMEIDGLNGNYNIAVIQNKIDKFLLGNYITIDMALELKEYAVSQNKQDKVVETETDVEALQKQLTNLTLEII